MGCHKRKLHILSSLVAAALRIFKRFFKALILNKLRLG